jgi:hypothetical protein
MNANSKVISLDQWRQSASERSTQRLACNMSKKLNVEEWLAIRKEEALKIDPEIAEVTWHYAQTLDPYGVYPDLPEECQCIGREYFARLPGSDIWVHFGDLPDEIHDALWQRHESKLAFPAGLEALFGWIAS